MRKLALPFGLLALGAGIGASSLIPPPDASQMSDQASRDGSFEEDRAPYQNCRDAFQNGRMHILRGEPAYLETLDAGTDGKACEPYAPINR